MKDSHGQQMVISATVAVTIFTAGTWQSARGAAAPESPDRPGRATPNQAGQPNVGPVPTQPSTQPLQPAMTDEDLLKETKAEMALPSHPDQDLLKWYGVRPLLETYGLEFAGAWTVDESVNTHGGIGSGDVFRNLLDMRLSLDTKPLLNLTGGLFSIDFQNQSGRNGSDDLTGDVQGFDTPTPMAGRRSRNCGISNFCLSRSFGSRSARWIPTANSPCR